MHEWLARFVDWFRRDRLQDELEEELRFHRERLERDARHEGASADDAPDVARQRLGSTMRVAERTRDEWSFPALDQLLQDVRYAWRGIVRTPGVAVMVVATLALGVGATAAMFGFLDRIFVRPPSGVHEPDSLRRLWITRYGSEVAVHQSMHYPAYVALTREFPDVDIALFTEDNTLRIGRDRSSPPVHAVYATWNYFRVLRVRPELGRFYVPAEDVMGAGVDVAVVSHHFWRSRLGGDSAIVGKPLMLGTRRYVVIGVMQRDFNGLDVQAADVWLPLAALRGTVREGKQWYERTTTYGARTVMRVPDALDDAAFGARATVVMRRVDQELRRGAESPRQELETGSIISARGPGRWTQETSIATRLGGVTLVVFAIAVANVINLLLARAMGRRREIAVRLALGITRARLVRMLTVESLLLAFLAAAGATLSAWWGGDLLRALLMPDIEWIDSAFDARVMLFTFAAATVAGLLAGIIPAMQAVNPRLTSALKAGTEQSGFQSSRLRSGLVALQSAFSVALLFGATLFVRSLQNVEAIDIGYDRERTMIAELDFEAGENPGTANIAAAMEDIARRIAAHPGVEHVGRSTMPPLRGYGMRMFYIDGDTARRRFSSDAGPLHMGVSHGFFTASDLRLQQGRLFGGGEYAPAQYELVIDRLAVAQLFANRDPLGQCVRFGERTNPCHTIVGIVEDVNTMALIEERKSHFYVPLSTDSAGGQFGTALVVRVRPDAMTAVGRELQRQLRAAFPLGYATIMTMSEVLSADYRPWRLGATLFTAFGALALAVVLVGIYSTVSYTVSQRTHEFGVRIALGANGHDVINQVLSEGLRVVSIGVAGGLVLAFLVSRLVQALLFGVEATDPSAMLLAACTLLAVAMLAGLFPAWRASRVNPVISLKAE